MADHCPSGVKRQCPMYVCWFFAGEISLAPRLPEVTWLGAHTDPWAQLKSTSLHMCVCTLSHFSHVQLSTTVWTVAHQAPLSMGFSRHEYWPPPGDVLDPGIKPNSSGSCTAGRFSTTEAPGKLVSLHISCFPCELLSVLHVTLQIQGLCGNSYF